MSPRAKVNAIFAGVALLIIAAGELLDLGFSATLQAVLFSLVTWALPSPGRVADRRRPKPLPDQDTAPLDVQ